MAGEFEQLLPFSWRGETYPVIRVQMTLAHDLVEHKYWGVDGARVEATGAAPIRLAASIPLGNHIFPGQHEKWTAGKLYPTALRKFLIDFGKRTTGLVGHPEFGEIACKPERLDFELAGDKRGATEIHASWVETLDDDVVHKIVASPVDDIIRGATDLEDGMANLRALVPLLPEFVDDIESLGRKLSSITDQVSILSYRHAGVVNRILYQARRLSTSIAKVKSALTWPAIQQLELIKSAAYTIRRAILTTNGIGLYVVPTDTTLAGVALSLPKNVAIGDVIKMNPTLVRGPVVARGKVVRYPLAA